MTPLGANSSRRLRRVIAGRFKAVESVCGEIRTLLRAQGLEHAAFPVELSARECLNNAVKHGNGNKARKNVTLELSIGGRWIRLQVTDEGPGFDWRRARKELPEDITSTHGRGLAICALFSERIAFNQRGNQITLWLSKNEKEQKT